MPRHVDRRRTTEPYRIGVHRKGGRLPHHPRPHLAQGRPSRRHGLRVLEADGSIVSWSYDKTYQLLKEDRSGTAPFTTTFAYDLVGNRLLRVHNGDRTTYLYDKANELLWEDTNSDRTTYQYDLCGNRTEKESPAATTFYAYDEDHRLTVAEPPAGAVTMTYNADAERVQKETPVETRKFLYDFENLLRETLFPCL